MLGGHLWKRRGAEKKAQVPLPTTKSVTRFFLGEGGRSNKDSIFIDQNPTSVNLDLSLLYWFILSTRHGPGQFFCPVGLGFGFLDIFSWVVKSFPFDSQFWLDLVKRHFLHQLFGLCKKIYIIMALLKKMLRMGRVGKKGLRLGFDPSHP